MRTKRVLIPVIYLLVVLLVAYLLRGLLFFMILTIVTGIISYFINRASLPFDVSPVFFGSIFIMQFYGIWYVGFFWLGGSLIPSLMGGGNVDFTSVLTLGTLIFVTLLVHITGHYMPYVLLLVPIYALVSSLILNWLTGESAKAAATFIVLLIVNSAYVVWFSKYIAQLGVFLI